jgi:uncharacterized protein DUF1127
VLDGQTGVRTAGAPERRLLLQLDEHMLKDLGLSAADAYAEANRSFWDVPSGCMDGSRGFSSNFVER